MNRIILILFIFSLLFSQNPCDGVCYTDEEAQNIEQYINELEQKDIVNNDIINNLNNQVSMYIQWRENDSLWVNLQNEKIQLLNDRIGLYKELVKEVEPKWYENRWIWFGIGVFTTGASIELASKVVK
tara:strand:+ start:3047 stop:3430 length:384 start_codon:yes stop_codon:yes gene_type:complete